MKSNEEKAREILSCHKCPFRTDRPHKIDIGENACAVCFDYKAVMQMAEWKDSEAKTTGWHNLSDGDFPKITGDYLTVCRNKNMEDGIFLYEVVYYHGTGWEERTNWEDIIAWHEIPTYM